MKVEANLEEEDIEVRSKSPEKDIGNLVLTVEQAESFINDLHGAVREIEKDESEEKSVGYGKVKSVTLREGDELPADLNISNILYTEKTHSMRKEIKVWYNASK